MYKNILIGLFALSTLVFMWLAVRNAQPLQCSDVLNVNTSQVCIVKRTGEPKADVQSVVTQLRYDSYKY